tara:strand:+ start:89 stop:445 length:357 start_codon:yes stop_codon:yes gene_type:complete
MKIILSLSAILITLTLTAQSNIATWYLNNTSGTGIQSPTSVANGNYSTAMGYNAIADGLVSTAMGYATIASAYYSTSMGKNTIASGDVSTVMGVGTTASDFGSTVIGQYNLLGSNSYK